MKEIVAWIVGVAIVFTALTVMMVTASNNNKEFKTECVKSGKIVERSGDSWVCR